MRRTVEKYTGIAKTAAAVLAVALIGGMANLSAARADEAQAKSLFKAMSDYMAGQKAIVDRIRFVSRGRHQTEPEARARKFRDSGT